MTTWELELTPEEWRELRTMLDDGTLEEESEMSYEDEIYAWLREYSNEVYYKKPSSRSMRLLGFAHTPAELHELQHEN